jgi:hypothetical protein
MSMSWPQRSTSWGTQTGRWAGPRRSPPIVVQTDRTVAVERQAAFARELARYRAKEDQ